MTSEMAWKVALCPDMIKRWPTQDIPFPWGGLSTGREGFGKEGFPMFPLVAATNYHSVGSNNQNSFSRSSRGLAILKSRYQQGRLPSKATGEDSLLLPPASGGRPPLLAYDYITPIGYHLWDLLLN